MSLITTVYVPDGIAMAADSRTTIIKDGNTRYKDDCRKIICFTPHILVGHCGEGMVTEGLSVESFLLGLKNKFDDDTALEQVPAGLLCELMQHQCDAETLYIIAGVNPQKGKSGVYLVNGRDKTITIQFAGDVYGACCFGDDAIADEIVSDIAFETLSLQEAKSLAELTVNTTIEANRYRNPQTVGGVCSSYIVSKIGL